MSIHEIADPAAILAAMEEYDRLGRTFFLEKYGFRKAREFMLRDASSGKLYDSKPIVGVAYGYAFPDQGPLSSDSFSGGEATVESLLTGLGFQVVRVGQDWTRTEVEATVADYFEMLRLEATGELYKKSEHNEALRTRLPTRSKGSIELKHQNISAVLDQLGLPFITGYKPRGNLQELLREVVLEYVRKSQSMVQSILDAIEDRTTPGARTYRGALIDCPTPEATPTRRRSERIPRKFDYATRDERNRRLGHSGESWVLGYEEERLCDELRPDLVSKIDWISDRLGDGTGYDILSFESSEVARFIEVKTTNGGSLTSFIVSQNEVEFSKEVEDSFCLYRVFNFARSPQLFILRGPLTTSVQLESLDYRARLRAVTR